MGKSKSEPRRKIQTICEYLKGYTCSHPRCIRGCGNECNCEHITSHGKYKGKAVWFHK